MNLANIPLCKCNGTLRLAQNCPKCWPMQFASLKRRYRPIIGKTFKNNTGEQVFKIVSRQNGRKDWVLGKNGWIKNKYEAEYENISTGEKINSVWMGYYKIKKELIEV